MARATKAPMPAKPVPLKTIHTYPSKNGNASLNIYSYPQRVPTFMGGSYERGWGALAGTVDLNVTEPSGQRITSIKLTLTATQVTTIPKTASVEAPSALDRMAITQEETKTKQVTLLQLEHILFEPLKTEVDKDAYLLPQGKHVYPFTIQLPLVGNKDKKNPPLLPPSCVIEPLIQGPNDAAMRQNSTGLFGRSKANGKDQARPAWATVKYQLKLTVQRTGLLKRNVRSYAPFVYLPSPPISATSLLLQRRATGAIMAAIILQRQGDGCQSIETPQEWRQRTLSFLTSPNGPQKLEPEKKAGFLSSFFGGSKKQEVVHWHEAWSFSMPMSGRSSFPLRSAIPFIVRCNTNKPLDLSTSSSLTFRLYRRLRLLTGKKQKPVAMQQEPVAEAALRYAVESRGVHRINGIIALPPNCVPTFEMHSWSLDYYVAVVRVRDGAVLHKEVVNLACPPPVEPKEAYGPYASGLAYRNAQQAAQKRLESPPSPEESPPLAPYVSSPVSASPSPPLSRQRPSFSSMTSSSSSSAHVSSRLPSVAPSSRSFRSSSTDSTHYASAASSVGQSNKGVPAAAAAASTAPMGLAGMANPPRASSAGASGSVYAPYSSNLDPVRERSSTPSSARAVSVASAKARATHADSSISVHDTSDTASIASSTRRRDRYSSRGAAHVPEPSSNRPSADQHPHLQDPTMYMHTHEKAGLLASTAATIASGSSTARRGLFVANADDLPSIPATASSSAREHANALVGAPSSSSRKPRNKRTAREPSSKASTSAPHRRPDAGTASARNARDADAPRPLPSPSAGAAAPPPSDPIQDLPSPPAFASPQQTTLVDPATLLTNEDLMYGEDMELDLPPSYFEAVHGAEEDEDDG
ncbi:hypothetical protein EX895_003466 [Sporisorium graminicola]|uniref:Arrestin-like N-terminal domain-containing protein n=1 Tax=Sporisorium graminicola TaxID=280036 RepID=A0A4U7KX45_9BASI|nr:hypothetical protein EX895_003466 [Sporisorium graminicola]TKY87452.1 hypothetical protein EX895_003466 [Sporisorium graminicola]